MQSKTFDNVKQIYPKLCARAQPNFREYDMEEVSKHNILKSDTCLQNDVQIVIDNQVYNISSFVDFHPGGIMPFVAVAGKECTNVFLSFHPNKVLEKMLPRYKIGVLKNKINSKLIEDFTKLKNELVLKNYFKTDLLYYFKKSVVLALIFYCSIYLTISCSNKQIVIHSYIRYFHCALASFLLGIFQQQLSFFGHDVGHNSLSQSRNVNFIYSIIINALYGVSSSQQKKSHNFHHIITNSVDYDPDIQHLPFFAISTKFFDGIYSFYHLKTFVFSKFSQFMISYQHILYFPILIFARFNLYLQGYIHLLDFSSKVYKRYQELASVLVFLFQYSFLVSTLPNQKFKILFVGISHFVCSIVHVQITLSHFAMNTYFGTKIGSYTFDSQFRMQTETTLDIDCYTFMDQFHGGLQFQVIHHIFPRLPRHQLRTVRDKYILPLLKKHGIEYHSLSFFDSIKLVLKKLKSVAKQSINYNVKYDKLQKYNYIWQLLMCDG